MNILNNLLYYICKNQILLNFMDKTTFLSYEEARQSGEFNMIMDAHQVQKEYGITSEDYWYIVKNYTELAKKYL